MIMAISIHFVSKPRLTMSTVAPAGGCEALKWSNSAPESAYVRRGRLTLRLPHARVGYGISSTN
jgi:hypothetical protein